MNKGVKENKRGGYVLLRKGNREKKKSVTFLYVQEKNQSFGKKERSQEQGRRAKRRFDCCSF